MANKREVRHESLPRSSFAIRTTQQPKQIVFPETQRVEQDNIAHKIGQDSGAELAARALAEASRNLPRARVQGRDQLHTSSLQGQTDAPKSKGEREFFGNCVRCNHRGYITFAQEDLADVRLCTCQEEVCPQCYGAGGFEVSLESGNRAWKTCDCQKLARRMELFRSAQIPARFADKAIDAFAPNHDSQGKAQAHFFKLYDPASGRCFQPGERGVLLMGPPGVGKTHLMVGFLRNLTLEHGIACRFQDFGLLLSDMRDGYTRDIPEQQILQPLIDIEVLLIDDLGKGRNSKWELGIIDTLISCRYNAGHTTLITTNYTQDPETTLRERSRGRGHVDNEEFMSRDTLRDRVGDRIYSRLHEMCKFFFVRGEDYRQRANP